MSTLVLVSIFPLASYHESNFSERLNRCAIVLYFEKLFLCFINIWKPYSDLCINTFSVNRICAHFDFGFVCILTLDLCAPTSKFWCSCDESWLIGTQVEMKQTGNSNKSPDHKNIELHQTTGWVTIFKVFLRDFKSICVKIPEEFWPESQLLRLAFNIWFQHQLELWTPPNIVQPPLNAMWLQSQLIPPKNVSAAQLSRLVVWAGFCLKTVVGPSKY